MGRIFNGNREKRDVINETLREIFLIQNNILKDCGINEQTYNNRLFLYEGLIKSYSVDKFLQLLHKHNYTDAEVLSKVESAEAIGIPIDTITNTTALNHLCTVCGWQYARNVKKKSNDTIYALYTRKFSDDADELVYEKNRGFVYHITPKQFNKKIFKNGLIPKSNNKIENHQDAVYCLIDPTQAPSLAKELQPYINWKNLKTDEKGNDIYTFTLWEIDLNKLNNEKDIFPKFFLDPMMNYSVYTKDNIKPQLLRNIGEVNLVKIDDRLIDLPPIY